MIYVILLPWAEPGWCLSLKSPICSRFLVVVFGGFEFFGRAGLWSSFILLISLYITGFWGKPLTQTINIHLDGDLNMWGDSLCVGRLALHISNPPGICFTLNHGWNSLILPKSSKQHWTYVYIFIASVDSGRVVFLSADVVTDPRTHQSNFQIIQVADKSRGRLHFELFQDGF